MGITLESGIVVPAGIMVLVGIFVKIDKRTGWNKRTGGNYNQTKYKSKSLSSLLHKFQFCKYYHFTFQ